MLKNFDDFSRRPSQEQSGLVRLAKETTPEWSIMKGFASDFDGRMFVGHKFRWISDPSSFLATQLLVDSSTLLFQIHFTQEAQCHHRLHSMDFPAKPNRTRRPATFCWKPK